MNKRFGTTLLILGIGSFILPLFGWQFVIISLFGRFQQMAALLSIILGGVLIAKDER